MEEKDEKSKAIFWEEKNSVCDIFTAYHPFAGLPELNVAVTGFISHEMEGRVYFAMSIIISTAGLTPAGEMFDFPR